MPETRRGVAGDPGLLALPSALSFAKLSQSFAGLATRPPAPSASTIRPDPMRHVSSSASLASSPARLLAGLALLATLTCAVSVQAQVALPDFGDPSSATMSSGEERALGEAFMREVRARLPLVEDPEVNGYIQSLGYRIASQSERQRAFTFFVVDEPVINAFAAPGGYIGIYRGLILASESEGELASVLAHETAHVTQNHLARSFERAGRVNIAAILTVFMVIHLLR